MFLKGFAFLSYSGDKKLCQFTNTNQLPLKAEILFLSPVSVTHSRKYQKQFLGLAYYP
jgi:hypothetical protein